MKIKSFYVEAVNNTVYVTKPNGETFNTQDFGTHVLAVEWGTEYAKFLGCEFNDVQPLSHIPKAEPGSLIQVIILYTGSHWSIVNKHTGQEFNYCRTGNELVRFCKDHSLYVTNRDCLAPEFANQLPR